MEDGAFSLGEGAIQMLSRLFGTSQTVSKFFSLAKKKKIPLERFSLRPLPLLPMSTLFGAKAASAVTVVVVVWGCARDSEAAPPPLPLLSPELPAFVFGRQCATIQENTRQFTIAKFQNLRKQSVSQEQEHVKNMPDLQFLAIKLVLPDGSTVPGLLELLPRA